MIIGYARTITTDQSPGLAAQERDLIAAGAERIFSEHVSSLASRTRLTADVGRGELRSCRWLLRQALRHMLKAKAWPLSRDAPTWRADAIDFRRQARDAFTPSIRQKIDVAALYADAFAAMPETMEGQSPLPVPEVCPVTLDERLSDA